MFGMLKIVLSAACVKLFVRKKLSASIKLRVRSRSTKIIASARQMHQKFSVRCVARSKRFCNFIRRTLRQHNFICPIIFVKNKVALENLNDGQILELRLNDGEPIQNVPRSLKDEGHKILRLTDNVDGTFPIYQTAAYNQTAALINLPNMQAEIEA